MTDCWGEIGDSQSPIFCGGKGVFVLILNSNFVKQSSEKRDILSGFVAYASGKGSITYTAACRHATHRHGMAVACITSVKSCRGRGKGKTSPFVLCSTSRPAIMILLSVMITSTNQHLTRSMPWDADSRVVDVWTLILTTSII